MVLQRFAKPLVDCRLTGSSPVLSTIIFIIEALTLKPQFYLEVMLLIKPAILFQKELEESYAKAICDPFFKFYNGASYRDFTIRIAKDDWNTIQRVSVDSSNNIIGLMIAEFDRDSRIVRNIGIMNFTKQPNAIFSKDLLDFMRELRDEYQANKFEFIGYVESPSEKMYRKFISKYGGRVVGVSRRTQKLIDGMYYNATYFEIMREEMNF